MDRSVTAHDLSVLVNTGDNGQSPIGTVGLVANETLGAELLLGKRHFYDALDPRLAMETYMSCASCHNEGDSDGRVWDFTQFGEGVRNTSALMGQAGATSGPVHWSGNFDELQDFEGQIREFAGGLGLMTDAQFNSGTRSQPLGDSKAGVSADLDALAAYVNSLTDVLPSPHRSADGSLSAAGSRGQALFYAEGCASCHTDERFTDSALDVRHDVGTLTPASGGRLGAALDGLDTPILKGLWTTAPYLHDGSAASLEEAISAHSSVSLTGAELNDLAAFVAEIDSTQSNTPPVSGAQLASFQLSSVDSNWQTIALPGSYTDPVLVCSAIQQSNSVPQVVRLRNVTGTSADIRLQNPSNAALASELVNCLVAEAGVWTLPDGRGFEAAHYQNTLVDENNSWIGEFRTLSFPFLNPVVLGGIQTANDAGWSVFWARGNARQNPPSAATLYTGLSVAEDVDTTRASERVGYFVIEAGAGALDGVAFEAFLGSDSVTGYADTASGNSYALTQAYGSEAVAIVSQAAEDGGNGGWAVLRAGVQSSSLQLSIDEDQIGDSERNHTTEQVAVVVIDGRVSVPLTAYEPPPAGH